MDRRFYGSAIEKALVDELSQALDERIRQANNQWATGELDFEPTTDDFVGIQYAPWYDNEKYVADARGWQQGNQQAAEAGRGQGWYWTVRDIHFLPRSETETIALFTVVHHWANPTDPPAEAVFLETWVKDQGRWRLKRHTAEKR